MSISLQFNPAPLAIQDIDEGKYYKDLSYDLAPMLRADFGESLEQLAVEVSFAFFAYGKSASARPYIDRSRGAQSVTPEEISLYLPAEKAV